MSHVNDRRWLGHGTGHAGLGRTTNPNWLAAFLPSALYRLPFQACTSSVIIEQKGNKWKGAALARHSLAAMLVLVVRGRMQNNGASRALASNGSLGSPVPW